MAKNFEVSLKCLEMDLLYILPHNVTILQGAEQRVCPGRVLVRVPDQQPGARRQGGQPHHPPALLLLRGGSQLQGTLHCRSQL